jgi:hypothetical protein
MVFWPFTWVHCPDWLPLPSAFTNCLYKLPFTKWSWKLLSSVDTVVLPFTGVHSPAWLLRFLSSCGAQCLQVIFRRYSSIVFYLSALPWLTPVVLILLWLLVPLIFRRYSSLAFYLSTLPWLTAVTKRLYRLPLQTAFYQVRLIFRRYSGLVLYWSSLALYWSSVDTVSYLKSSYLP